MSSNPCGLMSTAANASTRVNATGLSGSGDDTRTRRFSGGSAAHTTSRATTPSPSKKLPCVLAQMSSRGGTATSHTVRRRASVRNRSSNEKYR